MKFKLKYSKEQEAFMIKYRASLEQETPEIRAEKLSRLYRVCKGKLLAWKKDDWIFYLNYGQDSGFGYSELLEVHLKETM
jgi:hypothetical protein